MLAPASERLIARISYLTVGQTLSVDAALPNAAAATEVTVTDISPLIDTEKTEVSQTVDQQLVSNLPVNGRRWDNFVLLTPNVVPDGNTGLISYRGISGLYNTNLVDGANNQQAFFSEARGRSLRRSVRLLAGLHQGVSVFHLGLLGRVRAGRRRPDQRHHQDRHATRSTATCSTTSAIPRSTRSIRSQSSPVGRTTSRSFSSPLCTSSSSSAARSAVPSSRTSSSTSSPMTASAR